MGDKKKKKKCKKKKCSAWKGGNVFVMVIKTIINNPAELFDTPF